MIIFDFWFGKNDQELMEKQFLKDTKCAKMKNIHKTWNKGGNGEKNQNIKKNKQKLRKVSTWRERAHTIMGG